MKKHLGFPFNLNSQTHQSLQKKSALFWQLKGKEKALLLFHEAARRVPAYKKFLRKNKIDPKKIKTWEDFTLVPPINKTNYLRHYPLKDLCWDGSLDKDALTYAATSGTTGKPFYFPRDSMLDVESSFLHELFLRDYSSKKSLSTLVIICFGMGAWIGGLITYEALRRAGERSNPVSLITPGINKEEIFNALRDLAPKYEQVILCGYPPFMKDLIDEVSEKGIQWKKIKKPRIIFAAESFSERFRDYIARKTGIKNSCRDTMNIYGSADLGTMAIETPLSIALRRFIAKKSTITKTIFPETGSLPTLAQFNPLFTFFESKDDLFLVSGYNYLPLIRYDIGDRGGVIPFQSMMSWIKKAGGKKNILSGISYNSIPKFPFIYIYERRDLSVKFYGATIFPEPVKEALQNRVFENVVTGKFTMYTEYDKKYNQELHIHIELKPGKNISKTTREKILSSIVRTLLIKNSEYRNNFAAMPKKVSPKLHFLIYEDPAYFKPGLKQKWIKAT